VFMDEGGMPQPGVFAMAGLVQCQHSVFSCMAIGPLKQAQNQNPAMHAQLPAC
jgi:hypothetical protein